MADSTGLQFTVKVGALPESTFVVAEFALEEALNSPFQLRLELASPQPDVDFADVLDQPCELMVWYNGELQRRVCGVVSDFAQGDSGFRRTRYQLLVQQAVMPPSVDAAWWVPLRLSNSWYTSPHCPRFNSDHVYRHGKTPAGHVRYRCPACPSPTPMRPVNSASKRRLLIWRSTGLVSVILLAPLTLALTPSCAP